MVNKAREQHQDIATVVKLMGTHLNTYKNNALMNMSLSVLDIFHLEYRKTTINNLVFTINNHKKRSLTIV